MEQSTRLFKNLFRKSLLRDCIRVRWFLLFFYPSILSWFIVFFHPVCIMFASQDDSGTERMALDAGRHVDPCGTKSKQQNEKK